MCNLYDIGTNSRRNNGQWEATISVAIGEIQKAHGIRKTDPGLVLTLNDEGPQAQIMRWGFKRSFNRAINNARSDKLDGMWSESWQQCRRCLIPIQTFYEWTGTPGKKQAFAFTSANSESPLWAAGIWEPGDEHPAYSMLTTAASETVSTIHDRMPALLQSEDFETFLNAENPRCLLNPVNDGLKIYRCKNPLSKRGSQNGPQREDQLPGFDDI
jgi:putative SOS response-associated peptidase YedK